ncbi:MAG: hypothetical protein J5449_10585 [Oscillospiraceae bacterium]|nr:hypothetical protein [Oscillospiraceae bacterium]
MIRRTVSAALLLRDGFTGRTLSPGSVIKCAVDGERCQAVRKQGGYLVLMDLAAGEHTAVLQCAGYLDETLRLDVGGGAVRELAIDLRPGRGYPFPAGAAFLELTLKTPDTELWACRSGMVKLTSAQTKAGETELQLFARGPRELLPIPGYYMFGDAKEAELVLLREMDSSGAARVDAPLHAAHARGTELLFARRFLTDAEGRAELSFPTDGKVSVLCGGSVLETELKPGRQELSWTPGKK